MTVFTFNSTILLVSVGARKAMSDAMVLENFGKGAIFATPIRLYRFNGTREIAFNIKLKLIENSRDITFTSNWKKPGISTKIIKERHVVLETRYKTNWRWPLNISVYKIKRTQATCVRLRKRLLVAFGAETSRTSRRVLVGKKRKLKLG